MPRFTTASATRSSRVRSSVVNTSAPDLVEKAWEISARTLSHVCATDALEKEVITVWKGSQNQLASGIIWRGTRRVNKCAASCARQARRIDLACLVHLIVLVQSHSQEKPNTRDKLFSPLDAHAVEPSVGRGKDRVEDRVVAFVLSKWARQPRTDRLLPICERIAPVPCRNRSGRSRIAAGTFVANKCARIVELMLLFVVEVTDLVQGNGCEPRLIF